MDVGTDTKGTGAGRHRPEKLAAYFLANFLPASQTFVYNELLYHQRYDVEAFAVGRQNSDLFEWHTVHTLLSESRFQSPRALLQAANYVVRRECAEFERRLQDMPFDVAHAQFGPAAVLASKITERQNIPMLCTFGGVDVQSLVTDMRNQFGNWGYWPYYLRAPEMLQKLSRILTVSKELADKLISFGAPSEKVHVFYRGIEVPEFLSRAVEDREPIILLAGRCVEKKGFRYALEAFARCTGDDDWRVVIAGDGPLGAELEQRARELGVHSRVQFEGHLPQAKLFDWMERAAILAVPSVMASNGNSEGIPNVMKEASARGLPVVASRHGGLPEVIRDGETGYLVEERDVSGLHHRLNALMSDENLRRKMGQAARAYMKSEFDMPSRIKVLEQHYDEVIAEHRAHEEG